MEGGIKESYNMGNTNNNMNGNNNNKVNYISHENVSKSNGF
jgi:hypothetical protein